MARHALRPRLAFLVGGSEGIGAAVAEQLTSAGTDVAILSRSEAKLTAALRRLEERRTSPGQRLVTRSVDVSDETLTRRAVDGLVLHLGVPDLFVVTAGYARPGYLDELTSVDVHGMVAVNLLGTIHACRAIVPHQVRARAGTIVTTSSMAGLAGLFGYTVYSATKFGVIGFSEALRRELAPFGVGVRVLCPPNTSTPGLEEENRHKPAEVLAVEESVATLSPDDVADHLLRALARRRGFMVIPGRDSRLAAATIRYAPALADRALRRPPADSHPLRPPDSTTPMR